MVLSYVTRRVGSERVGLVSDDEVSRGVCSGAHVCVFQRVYASVFNKASLIRFACGVVSDSVRVNSGMPHPSPCAYMCGVILFLPHRA